MPTVCPSVLVLTRTLRHKFDCEKVRPTASRQAQNTASSTSLSLPKPSAPICCGLVVTSAKQVGFDPGGIIYEDIMSKDIERPVSQPMGRFTPPSLGGVMSLLG
ncbi:unnamed protein product [Boreogadus saida]